MTTELLQFKLLRFLVSDCVEETPNHVESQHVKSTLKT